MGQKSRIEWTESTWIPVTGCTAVSPGCANCYAARMSKRLDAMGHAKYAGVVDQHGRWTGQINIADDKDFFAPLHRNTPTTYFVSSMSDIFHEGVSDGTLDRIYAVMALCPQHRFLVLTKRADRMQKYLLSGEQHLIGSSRKHGAKYSTPSRWSMVVKEAVAIQGVSKVHELPNGNFCWPLPNVAQGVSVENQAAVSRAHTLATTPAAMRFLSCEPLLGPLELTRINASGTGCESFVNVLSGRIEYNSHFYCRENERIHWVIGGGESGPGARPMHPDWARGLRDQCLAAKVPFFFKQWGEWGEYLSAHTPSSLDFRITCETRTFFNDGYRVARYGKKAAGRVLDGREWDERPEWFFQAAEVVACER